MSAEGKIEQQSPETVIDPEINLEEKRRRLDQSSTTHMLKSAIGWGLTGAVGLASSIFPPAINGLIVTIEEACRHSILAIRDTAKLNKTYNTKPVDTVSKYQE